MAERIDLTVRPRSSGPAEKWAFFCSLLRSVSRLYMTPGILAFHFRVLLPLVAYAGEASSTSRAYPTACLKVIARPSVRALSKVPSPNRERTAAMV